MSGSRVRPVSLALIALALLASSGLTGARACEPGVDGCLPTAEECASGDFDGVHVGSPLPLAAVCITDDGTILLYAAGDATQPCGTVVVADQTIAGSYGQDPNGCLAGIPHGSSWHEEYLTSADGTRLHANVYRPAGLAPDIRTPVLLGVGPYFGTGRSLYVGWSPASDGPAMSGYLVAMYEEAIARGYTVVNVSLRGYGGSGGCTDLGGLGEQADSVAAIEWAANQPWSNGRVATYGLSYEGWTQVMALAHDVPGHMAAVILSPVIDLYSSQFVNGVQPSRYNWALGWFYAQYDLTPPSALSDPQQHIEAIGGTASDPACHAENMIETQNPDPHTTYWRDRDLIDRAATSDVPTFWVHGFLDLNTIANQFLPVWEHLAGPKRAWFGQFPHVAPADLPRSGYQAEVWRWLECHIDELPTACEDIVNDPPIAIQEAAGGWRAESSWPPHDAVDRSLTVLPGSYTDAPGNDAEPGQGSPIFTARGLLVNRPFDFPHGVGSWTISEPLDAEAHVSGVASLVVDVVTEVDGTTLIAMLYDIDEQNQATLISRGAHALRGSGSYALEFFPQDRRLAPGHRLGLLLSGADDTYFFPGRTGTTVQITGGTLAIPLLSTTRTGSIQGEPGPWVERGSFGVPAEIIAERTSGSIN